MRICSESRYKLWSRVSRRRPERRFWSVIDAREAWRNAMMLAREVHNAFLREEPSASALRGEMQAAKPGAQSRALELRSAFAKAYVVEDLAESHIRKKLGERYAWRPDCSRTRLIDELKLQATELVLDIAGGSNGFPKSSPFEHSPQAFALMNLLSLRELHGLGRTVWQTRQAGRDARDFVLNRIAWLDRTRRWTPASEDSRPIEGPCGRLVVFLDLHGCNSSLRPKMGRVVQEVPHFCRGTDEVWLPPNFFWPSQRFGIWDPEDGCVVSEQDDKVVVNLTKRERSAGKSFYINLDTNHEDEVVGYLPVVTSLRDPGRATVIMGPSVDSLDETEMEVPVVEYIRFRSRCLEEQKLPLPRNLRVDPRPLPITKVLDRDAPR